MKVRGTVSKGYRIASGLNKEGVLGPNGEFLTDSFVRQRPFFEKIIPELSAVWTGTINVDISPRRCTMLSFDYTVTCEWHPGIEETFGVVGGLTVLHNGKPYAPAFIYYPMPSTIHVPRDSIIEILSPKILGLSYGDSIELEVPDRALALS